MIAFLGNETVDSSILPGIPDLSAQLDYPWNLYVMNSDFSNQKIVLTGIIHGNRLKWSPTDANLLAFSGIYAGEEGIFIYNLETELVYLLSNTQSIYDWSPEGDSIIIVDNEEDKLIIVDILDILE